MGLFSKDSTETKVFTPATPVNISPGLLSQLVSTKETDFTRQQLNDKFLEEKVSQLYAQREEETLNKFELKLNNALLQDSTVEDELSSKNVSKKAAEMREKLSALESNTATKVDSKAKEAKKAVKDCLLSNKGRPLNCYEEIQKFKEAAL
ncbi:HCL264Cp [Eremothecium sinecaudum]|uniref:HCL264Cp n=1 Tax=Eremothecium sinecaudum TaxID=45286 RepID=A0A0X8HR33_9SACH|nr:HCL264Cp [Eremothecium sinecaudum]AMD19887.1 HCL264Cp [Eremothecium sinecaudum]